MGSHGGHGCFNVGTRMRAPDGAAAAGGAGVPLRMSLAFLTRSRSLEMSSHPAPFLRGSCDQNKAFRPVVKRSIIAKPELHCGTCSIAASPWNTIRSSSTVPDARSFQSRCISPSSDLRRVSKPFRGSDVTLVPC